MIKKIALFLIALLPVGLMAQDAKLGHVNSQEILSLMPERADIEKALNAFQSDVEGEIVKMRTEYNNKLKDFVEKQDSLTETIKSARQAELVGLDERINTFSENAQKEYSKKAQSLTAPMIEKVKKAIDDVAVEGGYTYIFDLVSQSIVYESPRANDITPLVKKKLGLTGTTATKPAATTKPATKPAETKK